MITWEYYDLENIWCQIILKSTSFPSTKRIMNIHKNSWLNSTYMLGKYWFVIFDKVSGIICNIFLNNKSYLKFELLPFLSHIQI